MTKSNFQISIEIKENADIFSSIRRNDIAHHFKGCMAKKGLKISDVAERLGVSAANTSRMLNGKQNLTVDKIYALADALQERLVISLDCVWQEDSLLNINYDCIKIDHNWLEDKNFQKSKIDLNRYRLPVEAANDALPDLVGWVGSDECNILEQRA